MRGRAQAEVGVSVNDHAEWQTPLAFGSCAGLICYEDILPARTEGTLNGSPWSPNIEQYLPRATLVEALWHQLHRQREPVIAYVVRSYKLNVGKRSRRRWVNNQPSRRPQPEIDGLRERTQENDVKPGICFGDRERNRVAMSRYKQPLRIKHDLRIADAGQNLQEIFLQQELVIAGDRTGDQQISAVVPGNRLQRGSADVVRCSQTNGIR